MTMASRPTILVFDGNNVAHRYASTMTRARSPDGVAVAGLYGIVKSARDMVAEHGAVHAICVLDAGVPQYKKDAAPHYKQQREEKRAKDPRAAEAYAHYKETVLHMHHACKPAGIVTCRASGWEGDDVIAALCAKFRDEYRVIVVSSDKDFTALVSKHVQVFDTKNKVFMPRDPLYAMKRLMDPKESDNLDGAYGVGAAKAEKIATALLAAHPSVVDMGLREQARLLINFCQDRASLLDATGKMHNAVVEAQQNIRANALVTDLDYAAEKCSPELKWRRNEPDKRAFIEMCRTYGLMPFVEDISSIWPPLSRLSCPV